MKLTTKILALLFILLTTSTTLSAPIQVFGPQRYSASIAGRTYNSSFTHTQNSAQGVIIIVNGDGTDLSPLNCSGLSLVRSLLCRAQNLVRQINVTLTRPSSIEVSINGAIKVTSLQLQPAIGKYQTAIQVNAVNTLVVKARGLQTANITVDIKAESQAVNQSPIANFNFTPTTGIAPELVSFSGLTSVDPDGSIVNYEWNFGDGGTGSGAMPIHSYTTAGIFQITLTVTDNQGARSSKTQSLLISQNQLPVASFSSLQDPNNIFYYSFDASTSIDSDGSITEYIWDFGDSQTGNGITANHIYTNPGTYQVQLIVKDNKGGQNSKSAQVIIADLIPPQILSLSPVSGSTIGTGDLSIAGSSNEALSSAQVSFNGVTSALVLGNGGKSFNGSLNIINTGSQNLEIRIIDISGNETIKQISVFVNADHFWRYAECSTQESGL